ncbi:MAG: hypothetical protein PHQ46_05090 [Negativicutes bacterium]|nr:hypothetical protein [Negativicutes bacterium]
MKKGDVMNKTLSQQNGFLMLEIVLAVLIISIALVASLGMFINSTKANANAAEYTLAATLAQKQLEMLKLKDPHTYWAVFDLTTQTPIAWQDNTNQPPASYTVDTVASVCPENLDLVQVKVTVTWNKPTSDSNPSVTLTTFYPKISL